MSARLELNVPEGLSIYSLPANHHLRIRTVNMLERISQEIRRRTRVVRIFPNEVSCLHLVDAILMEISEDRLNGRIYLSFRVRIFLRIRRRCRVNQLADR